MPSSCPPARLPAAADNLNSPDYLDKCRAIVLENLRGLAAAPSVQARPFDDGRGGEHVWDGRQVPCILAVNPRHSCSATAVPSAVPIRAARLGAAGGGRGGGGGGAAGRVSWQTLPATAPLAHIPCPRLLCAGPAAVPAAAAAAAPAPTLLAWASAAVALALRRALWMAAARTRRSSTMGKRTGTRAGGAGESGAVPEGGMRCCCRRCCLPLLRRWLQSVRRCWLQPCWTMRGERQSRWPCLLPLRLLCLRLLRWLLPLHQRALRRFAKLWPLLLLLLLLLLWRRRRRR